jgi:hypothetical protein
LLGLPAFGGRYLQRTGPPGLGTVTAAANPANAPGQPPDTGRVAGFMTYTKYFNTVNPRGR